MIEIILIGGPAEHGKTSLANAYKDLLEKHGKKVCMINFADYLKFICKQYLYWDGEKDEKGRDTLQYEGTDHIRSIDVDSNSKSVENFINLYSSRFDYFIVSDWRFKDEYEYLSSRYWYSVVDIKILRNNYESSLSDSQKSHSSEIDLDDFVPTYTFHCDNGIENVEKLAKDTLPLLLDTFKIREKGSN